jgi:hypothetical protein
MMEADFSLHFLIFSPIKKTVEFYNYLDYDRP